MASLISVSKYKSYQHLNEIWRVLQNNLENIFQKTPWPVFLVDQEQRFLWCNEETLNFLARAPEEILGKRCCEIVHHQPYPPEGCPFANLKVQKKDVSTSICEPFTKKQIFISLIPIFKEKDFLGALHFIFDLSEVQNLRETVSFQEILLQALLDSSPMFILFKDDSLRWKLANKAALNFLGLKPEDCLGKTDQEIAEEHPRLRELLSLCSLTDKIALERGVLTRNIEEIFYNGASHIYEIVKVPVTHANRFLGLLVVGHDLTPLKKTHQKLKEYVESQKALLDGLPLGIVFVTKEGFIAKVNQAFCDIYGYQPEEVIGLKGDFLFPSKEEFEAFMAEALKALEEKGSFEAEIRQKRKNGEIFPLRALGKNLSDSGRIWIVEDLSAKKEAERRAKLLAKQLEQIKRLESLSLLAGGIAHDFNNLLTIVIGRAQLLRARISDEKAQKDIDIILDASQRAQELVNQILSFSGQGLSKPDSPLNLSALVRALIPILKKVLPPSVDLKTELPPDIPPITGNPSLIEQVIINLVKNAGEAMKEKGGYVKVITGIKEVDKAYLREAITGHELQEGEYVFLRVEDNGPGISEEKLPHIFDPFYSTKEFGRGLGLASVLGIIKVHHGGLTVRSEVGKGTSFEIIFPRAIKFTDQDVFFPSKQEEPQKDQEAAQKH